MVLLIKLLLISFCFISLRMKRYLTLSIQVKFKILTCQDRGISFHASKHETNIIVPPLFIQESNLGQIVIINRNFFHPFLSKTRSKIIMARGVVCSSGISHQGAILLLPLQSPLMTDHFLSFLFQIVAYLGGQGLLSFCFMLTGMKRYSPVLTGKYIKLNLYRQG